MHSAIVAYSYLSNVLAEKYDATALAYVPSGVTQDQERVYRSFNVSILSYAFSDEQRQELETFFSGVYRSLKNKYDVYHLSFSGVWFGDLLYGDHLRKFCVPTVDLQDSRFHQSLREALFEFIYWRDYFHNNEVSAVNVTHGGYLTAMPLRVALKNEVPSYQVGPYGCYRLSSERRFAYAEYYDYPVRYRSLSPKKQEQGLKEAQSRIARRCSGAVGVDMSYFTKSAFGTVSADRVLPKSDKTKILIAAHCFFDSPNGQGENLFVDFYEWMEFLGRISNRTDYDWYVKTHPDSLPGNLPIIKELREKYPKFSLLSQDVSHHQLMDDDLNFVLTVYGTVGFEYATLGKAVINASLCNPHVAYNFNIHPKSIEEYEKILLNLSDQRIDIDKSEIYEYYFMRHINNSEIQNWLFDDYQEWSGKEAYQKQFTQEAYRYYLSTVDETRHLKKKKLLERFVESGDYVMQASHGEI